MGLEPAAPGGIGAERALWAMKRGGRSGTARSDACGATMHVPRVETGGRNVWKRKGALARLFRFPGRQPKYSRKNVVSEQAAKQPTIEMGLIRKAIIWTQICSKSGFAASAPPAVHQALLPSAGKGKHSHPPGLSLFFERGILDMDHILSILCLFVVYYAYIIRRRSVRMSFVWETPEEINLALAKRLSRIRKRRNLSQVQLSEKSNVSYGSIKRFETSGQISF